LLSNSEWRSRDPIEIRRFPRFDFAAAMPVAEDVAFAIRDAFSPGMIEEAVVQYIAGLFDDPDEDEVLEVTGAMLQSSVRGQKKVLEALMNRLRQMYQAEITGNIARQRPTLVKLDRLVDMSKTGSMSNTIALSEGVDLESINKGK
jgi:ATP-binding cassette subfamily F protein 3